MGYPVFTVLFTLHDLHGPIVVNIMPQNGQKWTFSQIYGTHGNGTMSFTLNSCGTGICMALDMGLVTRDNTSIIYRPWPWFPRTEAGNTQFISRCTRFTSRLPKFRTRLIPMQIPCTFINMSIKCLRLLFRHHGKSQGTQSLTQPLRPSHSR